ncbi:hypothetical protein GUJ93_ZPchr0006g43341 [Zizania palustris]|uniref:shikimate kinase n=1 Tax=Zizania palustris TaxID=103762 RepID=A0A8J5TAD2_ZIZPA|nr:hypothetical protein GUJ93_ZPchr0006g43341 [Zizania palustris]
MGSETDLCLICEAEREPRDGEGCVIDEAHERHVSFPDHDSVRRPVAVALFISAEVSPAPLASSRASFQCATDVAGGLPAATQRHAMEAGAGLVMPSSRAVGVGVGVGAGPGERRTAVLGGGKRASARSLRIGGGSAGAAVAVRARGAMPVALVCCLKASRGHDCLHNSVDEALLLKRKSEEVLFYLNGRCIYLVGMMGSGKSTVAKILAEVLGYSFFDSDKLVEQAVDMPSVAQIFKVHSEPFFRDNESIVLRDLSSMQRLVVATGGGAVIRPVNWKYMKKGLSVWLDVPLDALAKRISQVGTASRPLLDQQCSDPYTAAFSKLSKLAEQRGDAYANADARVSLEEIAAKQGHDDVSKLTPTDIAIEALYKIENFVTEHPTFSSQSPRVKAL